MWWSKNTLFISFMLWSKHIYSISYENTWFLFHVMVKIPFSILTKIPYSILTRNRLFNFYMKIPYSLFHKMVHKIPYSFFQLMVQKKLIHCFVWCSKKPNSILHAMVQKYLIHCFMWRSKIYLIHFYTKIPYPICHMMVKKKTIHLITINFWKSLKYSIYKISFINLWIISRKKINFYYIHYYLFSVITYCYKYLQLIITTY